MDEGRGVAWWPGRLPSGLYDELTTALAAARWAPDDHTGDAFRFDVAAIDAPRFDAWLDDELAPSLGLLPFRGGWKRLGADPWYRFPWHRDHRRGGDVGVVVNCSAGPVEGGVFEQRCRLTRGAPAVVPSQPRDVHTFDVDDPRWEHRVTPVRGPIARVVYAGWAKRAG